MTMLESLRIRNFILIDDCRIDWRAGFNALTGETGAGKSVVIAALGLLLGERGSPDAVRDPSKEAYLEAAFALDPKSICARQVRAVLEEAGAPMDEDMLLIARRIAPGGRSRHYINNSPCLLKTLETVGALLADLHGQHEHQSLLRKSAYLPLLDQYGDHADALNRYQTAYQTWREMRRALHTLDEDERERRRREDMLRFQRDEIDKADLAPNEDEEVESRLRVIQHAERLSEGCRNLMQTLVDGAEGRPALIDELDRLDSILGEIASLDASALPIAETWRPALISLRECAREIEAYASGLEYDPSELDALQERRYLIRELKTKYGAGIEDILAFRERAAQELERIEHADEERERLLVELDACRDEMRRRAEALRKAREKTAETITRNVMAELAGLGMESARFEAALPTRASMDDDEAFGPLGTEEAEFLISTIPGKPLRPLRESASGGEISRIMLALKCAFGEADPVPLMVFDEIDVGIGGETAEAAAERIARLAQRKQVICITHLPQIASRALHNLKVEKREENGALYAEITALTGKARERELARMLGAEDSADSQRYARAMLKAGKK